jgi:copper oxidase (laccase) domain-containing protein
MKKRMPYSPTNRESLYLCASQTVFLCIFTISQAVIGIAHAGRIGTLNRIAADWFRTLQVQYGSNLEDIHAGIGPSIGPDHYEVKEDVMIKQAERSLKDMKGILDQRNGKTYLNLWEANRRILTETGVTRIELQGSVLPATRRLVFTSCRKWTYRQVWRAAGFKR